ncbi:MAG: hypothetical protein ACXWVT_14565 [Burkholderiaceae bacterium]
MSEHANEHDPEYGPTPPGAKYEHTDIDVNIGYQFALWLSVAMLMSVGIIWGTFYFFENQQKSANTQAQKYPLSATMKRTAPPLPNLQKQPFKDIFSLRDGENKQLTSYGWVDKAGGITHIPIDRAMEVMLQKGFPTRAGGGDALNVVTQDSSSGRTTAPR